jgi:hypothetical protein
LFLEEIHRRPSRLVPANYTACHRRDASARHLLLKQLISSKIGCAAICIPRAVIDTFIKRCTA